MAITLVGYQTVVVTSSSTPIDIPVPSGVQPGDLLLVHLGVYSGEPSVPDGWRRVQTVWSLASTGQAEASRMFVAFRIADGTEPTSYSFGSGVVAAMGGMTAWRGVDAVRPFEDWAFVGSVGSVSALTFPSCGMGGSDRVVLRLYGQVGTSPASVNWGSGISEIYNVSDSIGGRAILAQETSANASARDVTLSAAKRCQGMTLVLLPSGATPSPQTGLRGASFSSSGSSSVTSRSLGVPYCCGDEYLVLASVHSPSVTATPPSGFTALGQGSVGTSARLVLWGKQATASEPQSITVSYSASTSVSLILMSIRGVRQVHGLDGAGITGSTTLTYPAVPVTASLVADLRIAGVSSTQAPSAMTGFSRVVWTYALGGQPALADWRVLESVTTSGTATVTFANTVDAYGFTLVLAPPVAAVELVGTGIGEARTAAGIERVVGLVGEARGSAWGQAILQREVWLSGLGTGDSRGLGLLGVERLLSGIATGYGFAHADLSVLMQVLLAGRAVGTSGAGAALLVERLLAGRGSGTAAAAGSLLVERLLGGRGVGEARASGALLVPVRLVGRAVGVGAARGSIATPVVLVGRAIGVGVAWAPPALDLDMSETHLRTVWATTRPWVAVEGETETDGTLGTLVIPAELLIDAMGTSTVVVARVGLRPLVPSSTPFAVGVESALAALEPGDVVPVVLPLEAGGGAVGLCRVLAIDEDPDRGEVRLQVQFIGQLDADDVLAYQDVGRPRVATDRATNLGRVVRELRRR